MCKISLKLRACITGILLFLAFTDLSHGASVVINEFLASNETVLADGDGDYVDWIELYNPGTSAVNLNGYALSDDRSVNDRWILPDISMEPNGFLLIHASGKDRKDLTHYWDQGLADHWETIITQGDSWRYLVTRKAPPVDWRTLGFDDAKWPEGPSGFGYGDGDDATGIAPFMIAIYIRKTFVLDDIDEISHLLLHVDYDDGFVAYLNDVEIARVNIGVSGVPPEHYRTARANREAQIYQGGFPEPYVVENAQSMLRPGKNVLAIQVHNVDSSSSDLSIIPFLTLGMAPPPSGASRGMPPLLHPRSTLHTNFRLDREGEFIGLYDPSGTVLDSLTFGEQIRNISWGRQPDGGTPGYYFSEPTPSASNSTPGVAGVAFTEPPTFSQDAGFSRDPVHLTLRVSSPNADIHYTLDGSDPVGSSPRYSSHITIDKTAVVRARTFNRGFLPGPVATRTYLINESFSLPVISLATDPPNLWDEERGIYAFGKEYESNFPHFGANFWEDWERPIHIEYFEPDGSIGFSLDAGAKIHGGYSRAFAQKSLRIHCRGRYGEEEIAYRIFDDKPIDAFKVIVLRNSGNDWDWKTTLFRDALMHELIKDTDVDRVAYKPAIVFLNGEFWGIHNIRERQDRYYLQSNRGIDPENLDILENQSTVTANVIEGDTDHYSSMIEYIKGHPLNIRSHLEHIQTLMDTDNFMDYCIFQIYGANTDWPGNNIKYWRPRTPEGRWRWLLFDTDFGFGAFISSGSGHNSLAFATEENGPGWPNPPWSTFLLRKLLENEEFRIDFINRFADLMNSTLLPERVKALIDRMKAVIEPYMPRHKRRWGGSMRDWYEQVEEMERFADKRRFYIKNHIFMKFGLRGAARVTLDLSPGGGGRIRINTLTVDTFPWTGTYFKGVPVELTAIPRPGYVFSGWSAPSLSDTPTVEVNLARNYSVIATFEPDPSPGPIVINEINYNSAGDLDADDWVELHSVTSIPTDISGWRFLDEEESHSFTLPNDTVIPPFGYLVLCRDASAFHAFFPEVDNYLGDFDFGLSAGGEQIRLYDDSGDLVDSLTYEDGPPWPAEPDGDGPTLELRTPRSDNADPANWGSSDRAVAPGGTPGAPNSISGAVTAIPSEPRAPLPVKFSLRGNHPNPFNASTTIRYTIGELERGDEVHVDIRIYNIAGKLVDTLVNRRQGRGEYRVTWDGRGFSNGVYFYQWVAKDVCLTGRMLLLR